MLIWLWHGLSKTFIIFYTYGSEKFTLESNIFVNIILVAGVKLYSPCCRNCFTKLFTKKLFCITTIISKAYVLSRFIEKHRTSPLNTFKYWIQFYINSIWNIYKQFTNLHFFLKKKKIFYYKNFYKKFVILN